MSPPLPTVAIATALKFGERFQTYIDMKTYVATRKALREWYWYFLPDSNFNTSGHSSS